MLISISPRVNRLLATAVHFQTPLYEKRINLTGTTGGGKTRNVEQALRNMYQEHQPEIDISKTLIQSYPEL